MKETFEKIDVQQLSNDLRESVVIHDYGEINYVFDAEATAEKLLAKGYQKQRESVYIVGRSGGHPSYLCSNCGKGFIGALADLRAKVHKYCHYCGSKMVGIQ